MIFRSAVILLAAGALCACGGLKTLNPEAPAGVNLAGTWKLNRQASDDPQAMLDRMRQEAMKHMRRRGYGDPNDPFNDEMDDGIDDGTRQQGRSPDGSGGSGRSRGQRGPSQSQTPERDNELRGRYMQRSTYGKALGGQLNLEGFTIEQTPSRISFIGSDWRRSFTPGTLSVVSVADGVADQSSGWEGREYVIEVRPQVGPRVLERYGLSADNHQLVEKITLQEEGLPKLEFTRVYEPGVLTPRGAPTSN
ncbi:MAG: hypothetical protein ABI885_27330 [Gammaproteobacteria bacterium]